MKKTIVALIPVIFLVALLSRGTPSSFASATGAAEGPQGSGHSVSYDHWSLLTVVETITDLGAGTWRYSYEFTNTETSAMWHFGIWTRFVTTSATPFSLPDWDAHLYDIWGVYSAYDARNLDPLIIWLSATEGHPWVTPSNPLPVGAIAEFSFEANVFDSSPKYYYYEFVGTYAGPPDLPVTAVGLTGPVTPVIPEVPLGTVMSFFSMSIALLGFVGFKRFRSKFRPQ